jgi:hypothetical protein
MLAHGQQAKLTIAFEHRQQRPQEKPAGNDQLLFTGERQAVVAKHLWSNEHGETGLTMTPQETVRQERLGRSQQLPCSPEAEPLGHQALFRLTE